MTKRTLAALIWFAAIAFGYDILWSVAGAPRVVGPAIAALGASLVGLDPMRLFWQGATSREEKPWQLPSGDRSAL